jgi:hypothetical protein
MHPAKRFYLKWTRTLHIYLSVFALIALALFAATGFMLNHRDWFGLNQPQTTTVKGNLPTSMAGRPLDRLALAEFFRANHGAAGLVDDFTIEEDQPIRIEFKSPGRAVRVTVEQPSGEFEVVTESYGVLGRLTELHRGSRGDSGPMWCLVIDVVSVLFLLISLTGLLLWFSLKRRFVVGVFALLLGTAALVGMYFAFVP